MKNIESQPVTEIPKTIENIEVTPQEKLKQEQSALEKDEVEIGDLKLELKKSAGRLLNAGFTATIIISLLTGILGKAKAEEIVHQVDVRDKIVQVDEPPDTLNKVSEAVSIAVLESQESADQSVETTEINPIVEEFVSFSEQERIAYLEDLFKQEESTERYDIKGNGEGPFYSFKTRIIKEAGPVQVIQLKEDIERFYEEINKPIEKEEVNQAFLTVHKFILEKVISWPGQQEVVVWNGDNQINIGEFLSRLRNGQNIFNQNDLNVFLERDKEGELLSEFLEEVRNVSGNELSKIKQIYDLIAYRVPRYKWYGEENNNNYQTFEQLLNNRAGICTEKNALLVYALREAGFEAQLWGFTGHIYTRVTTSEGVLEIDVTNSDPFSIRRQLVTNCCYSYSTPNGDIDIELNSDENIKRVAELFNLSVEDVNNVIRKISDVKPHPLYEIAKNGPITPDTIGKYKKDIFLK